MSSNIFSIGIFEVRWYSLLILLAFVIGILLIEKEAVKQKIDKQLISNLCFYLTIVCILGSRIYYVLFNMDYYGEDILGIFKIWEGGLAIHGGILSGIIFIIWYSKKYKISLLKILDIFAPPLILGQAIGRWGNFFNQEAYGAVTTYATLKKFHIPNFIIKGMYIDNQYWQPTFFYESIGCLIGFLILLLFRKYFKKTKGQITALYFVIYGTIRFCIESSRQDSLMFFNLKMAQIVSIIMIIIGIVMYVFLLQRRQNDK